MTVAVLVVVILLVVVIVILLVTVLFPVMALPIPVTMAFLVAVPFLVMLFFMVCIIVFNVFHHSDPGGGSGGFFKIEQVCVQDFVQIDLTVVACQYFCLHIQRPDNLLDFSQFGSGDLGGLVQQYNVAELNLLDYEVFQVLLIKLFFCQIIFAELIFHAQSVHNRHNAVQLRNSVFGVFLLHVGDVADCLGDRFRLANSAGFNHNVVELVLRHDVRKLFHQIHFQGAADAAVLQSYQTFVLLAHHTALLDKVRVNVDFSQIIHNNREADAFAVVQNMVHQSGFSAAQITRQQQYG